MARDEDMSLDRPLARRERDLRSHSIAPRERRLNESWCDLHYPWLRDCVAHGIRACTVALLPLIQLKRRRLAAAPLWLLPVGIAVIGFVVARR